MMETQVISEIVLPLLKDCGWGISDDFSVKMEYIIPTKDGSRQIADIVLISNAMIVAVIEVKSSEKKAEKSIQQAINYADALKCKFAFATNGEKIIGHNLKNGKQGELKYFVSPLLMELI